MRDILGKICDAFKENPFLRVIFPGGIYGAYLLFLYVTSFQRFWKTLALIASYVSPPVGSVVAIPVGFKLGFSPISIFFNLLFFDFVASLFIIWNLPLLTKIPGIGKIVERILTSGRKFFEKSKIAKGGTFLGLTIFVAIPIQGSGSVSGSIIGTLMGFPPTTTLGAALLGSGIRTSIALLTFMGVLKLPKLGLEILSFNWR